MTMKRSVTMADERRRRAEELAREKEFSAGTAYTPEQTQQMLHELRVHQIELELQNEELQGTQHELHNQRERYFDLYDQAPVGYLTLNEQGVIIEANLTAATLLGAARGALLKRPLTSYIIPEDQDIYYRQRKHLLETGESHSWEMRLKHEDGSTFWANLQAIPAQNGELWITLNDISEIYQSRLNQLKIEKMESLGLLAGGIAHDFNNILAVILGNISLARLHVNEPALASKRLEVAEMAVDRAKTIAKQLLTFARDNEPITKNVDVRAMLKEAAGFALHGSNVKCVLSLADELWTVEADEGQVIQVIHNLVLNAVQAMPNGGTLTISADDVVAHDSGKKFVRFSIADTGAGIPEEHLLKIFDPYFTTKQHGSGLGLATSHSIIQKHGGKIRASSVLGKGSTFTISLPASVQNIIAEEISRNSLYRGTGRVLVVDDEEDVRQITQVFLEELGYAVECAVNGNEAIACYENSIAQGIPFVAVILDLTIPGSIGGQDILKNILAINPGVKAIACSGYSSDMVMANYRDYGFSGMLCKPFRIEELSATMHEMLVQ